MPLPVEPVYDPLGRLALGPGAQVQRSQGLLSDTFTCTGSAMAMGKHFRGELLLFPRPVAHRGPHKGGLHRHPLGHSRVLHDPGYAGAFVFGRSRRRRPGGAF